MKMVRFFAVVVAVSVFIVGVCLLAACGRQERTAQEEALRREVLANATRFSEIAIEGYENCSVYKGDNGSEFVGLVILVIEQGYRSDIEIMVGVDKQNRVVDVKILRQKETKGKGTCIAKAGFLSQFVGADGDWDGTIDVISGSTISCSAVAAGVREALLLAYDLSAE